MLAHTLGKGITGSGGGLLGQAESMSIQGMYDSRQREREQRAGPM